MSTLFINACVRDGSRTEELAKFFLDGFSDDVHEIKLRNEKIQPLDRESLMLRDKLTAEHITDHTLLRYAKEFAAADTIVIAAPFWDLSFPSLLKIYLETISVCGITFRYENNAPMGLCRADRLFYITTAGGTIIRDFGFSYVKELAETFYGIKQTKCFRAEGLDIIGADVNGIMAKAKSEIEVWLALNGHNRPTQEM
ncbi:MAG: NAD(P)H-dependent oxidoreductase [Eubacteriales bacterium]